MDFRRASEVPHRYRDLVFRERRMTKAVAFLIFLVLTLVALGAGLFPELIPLSTRPPRFIFFLVAAGLLLPTLVSLFTLRASLRSSNWLIRFDGSKLYIKFRSYLNSHIGDDHPVVAALDPDEVEWIRKTTEKRIVPGRGRGERSESWTYLDLGLPGGTAELESHLEEERRRAAPRIRRTRTKAEHYPVQVPRPGMIRVQWNGPRTRIVPSADRAIAILGRTFPVLPEIDLRDEAIRDLDSEAADARILKHVQSGETLAAARLARRLYGLSLTEARRYVEELKES